jgi:hypothetical protein
MGNNVIARLYYLGIQKMSTPNYRFQVMKDAFGVTYEFLGPGLPEYANDIHFMQQMNEWGMKQWSVGRTKDEADRMLQFLYIAFEAGRQDMAAEIRHLLGAARR